ncbi:MAG: DUF1800 domain-containing protein [Xanthomonadaceae bacterium]|nr:DUF1800 domain-containing protein [Xanthomonadaceae bacterium]
MFTQRILRFFVVLAGACYALAPTPARAQTCPVGDTCFSDSFELPFNFPANDAEAARFLNQATFGATAADISAVRNQSIGIWLDNQLNSGTTTLSRPFLEAFAASLPAASNPNYFGITTVGQDQRLHRWYDVAVTAPDQVRQRVAWALSQIVITSDRDDFLQNEPVMMAEWNDIIVRNALGNYRDLIREVTFSPMMGRYLTTMRNRKFELRRPGFDGCPAGPGIFCAGNNGVQPDENYAREVMQLFTIGLLARDQTFYGVTPDSTSPNGFLSTYDEEAISGLARVFTGLAHDSTQGSANVAGVVMNRNCGSGGTACTGIGCRFTNTQNFFAEPPRDPLMNGRGIVHPDWYRPMVCYPRYNDNGRDTTGGELPDPSSLPAGALPPGTPTANKIIDLNTSTGSISIVQGPSTPNCHATGNALSAADQQACVNYCENNIRAAVDALFNHPNTPPMVARQMIQRLVTSNPTPQYVARVADAFVDNGAGVRGDMKAVVRAILLDAEARRSFNAPLTDVNFGKVREPILKLVALWRHFGAVSGDTAVFPATNPQGGAASPLAGQPSLRRWGPTNPQDNYQQRPLGAPSVFNFYEPDYKQPGQITQAGLFSPEMQIIHEVTSVGAANDLFARICSGYGGNSNNCSSGALSGPTATTPPNDGAYFPVAQVNLMPSVMTLINPAHNYLNLNPMHAKLSTWLVPTVAKLAPRRESNCASRR